MIIGTISWVSSAVTWAFSKFETSYSDALANFEVKDDESKALIETFYSRVSNDKKVLMLTFPWAAATTLYILLAREGIVWIPPDIMSNILLNPLLLGYAISLAFITSYHLATGYFVVKEHVHFVRKISKLTLNTTPLDLRYRTGLHDLGKFSFYGSMLWFVNVGVGVLLIVTIIDPITITLLAVLTIIGLLILLLPQIYLRSAILKYKKKLQRQIIDRFQDKWNHRYDRRTRSELMTFFNLFDETEKIEGWPFGISQMLKEVVLVVIPLFASVVGATI